MPRKITPVMFLRAADWLDAYDQEDEDAVDMALVADFLRKQAEKQKIDLVMHEIDRQVADPVSELGMTKKQLRAEIRRKIAENREE
jgi:hypothetical protein